MKVIRYKLGDVFAERGCVLALGFFDGVHLGHRAILSYAKEQAVAKGMKSAVFTFAYGGGLKKDSGMIYSEPERLEIFESLGIDVVFVADFSELRCLTPEDFVQKTLLSDIGASLACVGYNYRFGAFGAGDAELLLSLMRNGGAQVRIFDEFTLDGSPVSSTRVRTLLAEGALCEANEMLGAPYFIIGSVLHGRGDGTRFGYPTLNVPVSEERLKLKYGVYLTAVKIGEKLYTGLTNLGECPSFGKRTYHTETFLTDFTGDVYGMEIKVYFLSFLREERVFSSAKELSVQIEKDRILAEERLGNIKWQEIGLV